MQHQSQVHISFVGPSFTRSISATTNGLSSLASSFLSLSSSSSSVYSSRYSYSSRREKSFVQSDLSFFPQRADKKGSVLGKFSSQQKQRQQTRAKADQLLLLLLRFEFVTSARTFRGLTRRFAPWKRRTGSLISS